MKLKIFFAEIIIINNFSDIFWNKKKSKWQNFSHIRWQFFAIISNFSRVHENTKLKILCKSTSTEGQLLQLHKGLHNEPSILTLKPAPKRSQWTPEKTSICTLCITWLSENYKFPIWAYIYKFLLSFTEIQDLEDYGLWLKIRETSNSYPIYSRSKKTRVHALLGVG